MSRREVAEMRRLESVIPGVQVPSLPVWQRRKFAVGVTPRTHDKVREAAARSGTSIRAVFGRALDAALDAAGAPR